MQHFVQIMTYSVPILTTTSKCSDMSVIQNVICVDLMCEKGEMILNENNTKELPLNLLTQIEFSPVHLHC